ncbi:AAA family ATPase [Nodosilinea sp. FACHB-131]|uniref:AAA family ATPase n=1 Tax=Nodosilinea sp. FACHB-131 TaxID=2692832 RepID=UPI00168A38C7|nr:AAA family ATPase [Nodosilinea sp. FACHB-131]
MVALNTAITQGWIDWHPWGEEQIGRINSNEEIQAMIELHPHRAKLKKLGITYPIKAEYQDRLQVEVQGRDRWTVRNLTKRSEYTVTRHGLRLNCECDTFGNGFCKHRDQVESWIDANEVAPVTDEPKEFPKETIALWHHVNQVLPVETGSLASPGIDRGFTFPADFTPSDEQRAALQALGDWYYSEDPLFRLTGYAGTGKTTTIQAFVRHLRAMPIPPKLAVSAPFNKAKKVQERMMAKWGLTGIPAFTCAQLFGVRGKEVAGEEVFERDLDAYQHYQDYRIIIIDEVSTISENLWEFLLDAIHDGGLFGSRFVLMGDAAQLPPVGEAESMAFRHPCPSAELTQVQRYDGPIAVLADQVRQTLDAPAYPEIIHEVGEGNKGIYVSTEKEWMGTIAAAFTSQAYLDDPDTCRILAYTNARVNMLNVAVRNALGYREPWVVGERIIALAPYMPGGSGQPIMNTSDEATVTGLFEGSVSGWECYYLRLDTGETVPVPKNSAKYQAELAARHKAKDWSKYWALKRLFAQIAYSYALTAHRSQGSTFKYVFVDVQNLKRCKARNRLHNGGTVYERNQLFYVALTRASHRLFIFQ